jgi:hypothetical protein
MGERRPVPSQASSSMNLKKDRAPEYMHETCASDSADIDSSQDRTMARETASQLAAPRGTT